MSTFVLKIIENTTELSNFFVAFKCADDGHFNPTINSLTKNKHIFNFKWTGDQLT